MRGTGAAGTLLSVLAAVSGLPMTSGCASSHAAGYLAGARSPAELVAVPGTAQRGVRLAADAASRIGLTTSAVSALPPSRRAVPLAAVLFDKDGGTWVYVNAQPLLYVPTRVQLGPVDGDYVVLLSGPPVGTAVVTVGANELLGAEQGVAGEQ